MRPHEETQPPDPLRGFRTFVLVLAGLLPLAWVAAAIWLTVTGAGGSDRPGEPLWLLAYLFLTWGPLWLYRAMIRSPSGSAALGLLFLVLPIALLVAVPLTRLEILGATIGFLWTSWFWYPGIALFGGAVEMIALYPGYEDRWQAARWAERLRLEELQDVHGGGDR